MTPSHGYAAVYGITAALAFATVLVARQLPDPGVRRMRDFAVVLARDLRVFLQKGQATLNTISGSPPILGVCNGQRNNPQKPKQRGLTAATAAEEAITSLDDTMPTLATSVVFLDGHNDMRWPVPQHPLADQGLEVHAPPSVGHAGGASGLPAGGQGRKRTRSP